MAEARAVQQPAPDIIMIRLMERRCVGVAGAKGSISIVRILWDISGKLFGKLYD